MANTVFVSPGVYTSEKDLTFITSQVGVTTLGLVGETTMGPAFQPIFIGNYGDFQSFFGGLNATLVKDTGYPQYELPYIAKSYLSQSNQLFVTRVLGFSGYHAGSAWGITLDSAVDPSTVSATTAAIDYNPLISFTATTGGTIVTLVSASSLIQTLINEGALTDSLSFLATATTGATATIDTVYHKTAPDFSGASFNLYVNAVGTSGIYVTGTTTGATTYYSGTSYSEVEGTLVALLRSRGEVDLTTQLPAYEVTGNTGVVFDPAITGASIDPLAYFSLSGYSQTQGAFDYSCSFDRSQKNYITRVLGTTPANGNTAIYVETFYGNVFSTYNADDKIRGIKLNMVQYQSASGIDAPFDDYLQQYTPAVTPYFVSELFGNKVKRLFRLWTISDGDSANQLIKVSIANIDPDAGLFDVQIRSFFDTDARPNILENWTKCSMDPTTNNYIGKKIGTLDGTFVSKSSYVLVEFDDSSDTSDTVPAGFVGFPIRNYSAETGSYTAQTPQIIYNEAYIPFSNTRKYYLGISDTTGIDVDFFKYQGVPQGSSPDIWTGMTHGFHLDVNASAVTIDNVNVVINASGDTYSPIFLFDTGDAEFQTNSSLTGGPYEKLYARKFTTAPYGGFDGWDIYRTSRTNGDSYLINGTYGAAGIGTAFSEISLSNGDTGINSDYYAYLEAILTLKNPESVNINVLATPGINTFDNVNLVNATIDMVENDRADSLYIVTTPDTSNGEILDIETGVVDVLDGEFDSNYTATYWPWIQISDTENSVYIWVPPTRDVVTNIALTDNISFPWFAVAGVNRGAVNCIQARKKLTQSERDLLYENRINPLATFSTEGVVIWGNKTLQVKDTALNRINVRRLLLQARKLIAAVSVRLLFEPNDSIVRNQFLSLVNPILDNIRTERGLTDFRVVLGTNPADIDNNQLSGQIFLKPTRSLEFIVVEFDLLNTGASFDNV